MASKLFNLKTIFSMINKTCNKIYFLGKNNNSHASHIELHKHLFLPNKEELVPNQSLMFHVEEAILKSSSMFPYFMLVAFEGGSLLRAFILLLLYPFVCLLGREIGLKIMVFVSFVGIKVENFRIGRVVLPKFFLEDVVYERFNMVKACEKKVGVSDFPRVMVDGFLKHYLGIEKVIGRELKVGFGYYLGLMEAKEECNETLFNENSGNDVLGFSCLNKSLDQQSFVPHCKGVYLASEEEKRTHWKILPREKYPTPLIFHDGRLAFRPTPLATLAMFMWIPFGFILFLIRLILGLLLPYKLSIPILSFTGMRGTLSNLPKSPQHQNKQTSKGTLYVCNHKTLFDPIFVSIALMKPLTAVTYSLSKFSELIAPIKTVRLTRNRENDFKLIKELLDQGDVVMCPEGTTCREPYLLRFSPLFAQTSSNVVPIAINIDVSMFYATTAGGYKFLDPVMLLMNPYITCSVKILEKLPKSFTCQFGGKSKFEVANYVQGQISKASGFVCTSLTRKDKYVFLTGNEGII